MSKWKLVRLGNYTQIKTGKLDANASSPNGEYPFFTCSREPLKISSYSYDCECVLVAGNGDLNVKFYDGKFDAYQRTYIIESTDKGLLFVPYLYHFLDTYIEILREESIGGVIKYIKFGNLTEAKLPLPPLAEQQKIADTLDKVSRLIALRKTQLEKLDLLVKAKFVEMFGDSKRFPQYTLSEISQIIGGLTKNAKRNSLQIKMPYLRVANVHFNKLLLEEISEIGVYEKEIEKNMVLLNDLLIVEGNGSKEQIGRVALWDGSISPILHQNHLIKVRFNQKNIVPRYCLYYLMTQDGRKQIVAKSVSTSGLNTLSVSKVGALIIPLPPLPLQTKFADYVTQVETSKNQIQQGLEKLETLYQGLMQEYFE